MRGPVSSNSHGPKFHDHDEAIYTAQISREKIRQKIKEIQKDKGLKVEEVLDYIVNVLGAPFDLDRNDLNRITGRRIGNTYRQYISYNKLRWFLRFIYDFDPLYIDGIRDVRLPFLEHIEKTPWLSIHSTNLLGFGMPPAEKPIVRVGDAGRFSVNMPFEGYLLLYNISPRSSTDSQLVTVCLNPWLHLTGSPLSDGKIVLPAIAHKPIPVGGEASDSTLLAIASKHRLDATQFKEAAAIDGTLMDADKFLKVAGVLLALPATERSICMLHYRVL